MIKHHQDFLAGLLFLVVGIGFAWVASQYRVGMLANMGPGLMPLVLGALLALLGAALVFKALTFESLGNGRVVHWGAAALLRVLAGLFWLALCYGPTQWPWVGSAMAGWPVLGLVAGVCGLLLLVLPFKGPDCWRVWRWSGALAVVVCTVWMALGLSMPLWPTLAVR